MDMRFRYGGEEFAITLSELDFAVALKGAERIRRVVERYSFGIKNRFSGTAMTVSLGVAGLGGGDELGPEELLQQADDALYRSKEGGRNRVTPSQQDGS